MKLNKTFHIRLEPEYNILENFDQYLESESLRLGGMITNPEDREQKYSGGKFTWNLFENDGDKSEIKITLMRLWCLQMSLQMVNNKAHVDQINSSPKFDISEEEKTVFFRVLKKIVDDLHDDMAQQLESMVTQKKVDFNFLKNENS